MLKVERASVRKRVDVQIQLLIISNAKHSQTANKTHTIPPNVLYSLKSVTYIATQTLSLVLKINCDMQERLEVPKTMSRIFVLLLASNMRLLLIMQIRLCDQDIQNNLS